jgi:hypothetical protein
VINMNEAPAAGLAGDRVCPRSGWGFQIERHCLGCARRFWALISERFRRSRTATSRYTLIQSVISAWPWSWMGLRVACGRPPGVGEVDREPKRLM